MNAKNIKNVSHSRETSMDCKTSDSSSKQNRKIIESNSSSNACNSRIATSQQQIAVVPSQ
jgi:hypothetical protein